MRKIDAENPVERCSTIDTFTFDAWKEDDNKRFASVKTNTDEMSVKMISST